MRIEVKKTRLRAVSLFSGCGGLDLGFHNRQCDLIAAVDSDKIALETFARNISPEAHCLDVTSSDFDSLLASMPHCDIVLGGFPCQGFSKAGPKKAADPRNLLYTRMVDAVRTLRPTIFVAENVDGLSQNYAGEFLKKIVSDFSSLGYRVSHDVLDAAQFGVPQHRRRVFFVGVLTDHNFCWPQPTHRAEARNGESNLSMPLFESGNHSNPPRTISEAIGDIIDLSTHIPNHFHVVMDEDDKLVALKIGPGQKLCNSRLADTSVHTWDIPEVFGDVSEIEVEILETIASNRRHKAYGNIPNGNPLSLELIESLSGIKPAHEHVQSLLNGEYLVEKKPNHFDLRGAMFNSGYYKRPEWNKPSPTVITFFGMPRFFLHPKANRPFTVREAARLQSFPDDFVFEGSIEEQFRQIGNAVPPALAEKIAESVMATLCA